MRTRGWFYESFRHSLAAKGIRTKNQIYLQEKKSPEELIKEKEEALAQRQKQLNRLAELEGKAKFEFFMKNRLEQKLKSLSNQLGETNLTDAERVEINRQIAETKADLKDARARTQEIIDFKLEGGFMKGETRVLDASIAEGKRMAAEDLKDEIVEEKAKRSFTPEQIAELRKREFLRKDFEVLKGTRKGRRTISQAKLNFAADAELALKSKTRSIINADRGKVFDKRPFEEKMEIWSRELGAEARSSALAGDVAGERGEGSSAWTGQEKFIYGTLPILTMFSQARIKDGGLPTGEDIRSFAQKLANKSRILPVTPRRNSDEELIDYKISSKVQKALGLENPTAPNVEIVDLEPEPEPEPKPANKSDEMAAKLIMIKKRIEEIKSSGKELTPRQLRGIQKFKDFAEKIKKEND